MLLYVRLGDRSLIPSVKAILDTSVLIATDVPPLEGDLAISAAALAELHFGVLVTIDAFEIVTV